MAVGDEPNIFGGLSGHPRDVPGASRQVSGGSDPSQGHQAIVKELGDLHKGYRTIVEDLGKIKDELKAIGKLDFGVGAGGGSYTKAHIEQGFTPPDDMRRGRGKVRVGASRDGREARILGQEEADDGTGNNGGWRGRLRTAGQIGGWGLGVAAVTGNIFNRAQPNYMNLDLAQRNMMLGGSSMNQSTAMMRQMMQRHGGNAQQYGAASFALQSQGAIAGTRLSNVTLGGAAALRSSVAPEMEMADIAGVLGGLNMGDNAARLNRYGLRRSANDDPQQIMRRALQRLNQGRDLDARQLRAIRPGTTQFTYLSQVLGGEQAANLAIRQELGRATGQPIERSAAADAVLRGEGSEGLKQLEWGPEMAESIKTQTTIMQKQNQFIENAPTDWHQKVLAELGALSSGVGMIFDSVQTIAMSFLALRGGGLLGGGAAKKGGGVIRRAARKVTGRSAASAAGSAAARGAAGAGIAAAGTGLALPLTALGAAGGGAYYLHRDAQANAPDIETFERQQRDVVNQMITGGGLAGSQGPSVGDGIGDPGQTGGGSLLMQRTHHDASHVTGLHPEMRKRLEALFAANPKLRLNSGYRSPARQKQLWDEAVRKYGSESAARKWVAPPGKSNHNKGLAADIGPQSEYDWLKRNAPKFGLEPYAAEPWHWELAGTRSGQHENWSPGGGGLQGLATSQGKSIGGDGSSAPSSFGSSLSSISSSSASSIMGALGGGVPASTGGAVSSGVDGGASGTAGGNETFSSGAGSLSALQIARYAAQAGFSGNALIKAVAIAFGESEGNPRAHNPKPPDNSYGLWQINMLGDMGPARRRQFGLSSNSELFDPRRNAEAAFAISSGGSNFGPWSVYTSGKYQNYLAQAQQAVVSLGAGVGDRATTSTTAPTTFTAPSVPGGGGMRAPMAGPQRVTIQVMFNEATDAQAERFAKKVAAVMKGEDRIERIGAT